jgi:hypothetical protein
LIGLEAVVQGTGSLDIADSATIMVLLVVAILKNCRTNYSSYTFFSSLNAPKVRFSATLGQGPDIELALV